MVAYLVPLECVEKLNPSGVESLVLPVLATLDPSEGVASLVPPKGVTSFDPPGIASFDPPGVESLGPPQGV